MILDEIKGSCIEDNKPKENIERVLIEAGKDLAKLHKIPVDGFGFIDKRNYDSLKAYEESFNEYFLKYLNHDLDKLRIYDFSETEIKKIKEYMIEAEKLLDVPKAVLVHGDFDISHIFHDNNVYSGLIDFGEIRGCNKFYDLASFIGFYQDEKSYKYLLSGYREVTDLSERDLYSVELMALFIILRFLGKKYEHKYRNHWCKLAKKQLLRLEKQI